MYNLPVKKMVVVKIVNNASWLHLLWKIYYYELVTGRDFVNMYFWEWGLRKHRCCQQIMQISARGIVATIAESAGQDGNKM